MELPARPVIAVQPRADSPRVSFIGSNRSKNRPGVGVELDMKKLKLIAEFTEPITNRQVYFRPDGSITNW